MADTRGLLDRIAALRQRLEQTPQLMPDHAADPDGLAHAIRRLGPPPAAVESPLPPKLTARAHRLLSEARDLVARQKAASSDPLLANLLANSVGLPAAATDPLVRYHRNTVALTESSLRMVQMFPGAVDAQLRACDGFESLMNVVRHRLGVFDTALGQRKTDARRVARLAAMLGALHAGNPVSLDRFADLAEEMLDDARAAVPLRWLAADPGTPGTDGVRLAVAAHAVNVAQVMARLVPHDFEWATKPVVPVVAALLMDVGMLAVPAEVLATPGPLDPAARRLVEAHPRRSADVIRVMLPETGPLADVVLAHHERIDGTGYPGGLAADAIPPLARFLAAADTYAAMAAARPHRPASDPRAALTDTLLAAERGHLDRDFTEYLLALSFHPVGTVVELTDGRVAVVASAPANRSNLRAASRPVVAVLADAEGKVLARPEFLDLAAADRGGIVRAVSAAERREKLGDWYPDLCG